MNECLFEKAELEPQKIFLREFDLRPKKQILTAKELFVILDKKRDELNAKGDFITMGCPYKVYLANKDEIDKECQRRNMSKKSENFNIPKKCVKNFEKN